MLVEIDEASLASDSDEKNYMTGFVLLLLKVTAVKGAFYQQRERHVSKDVVTCLTNQARLLTPCPVC